MSLHEQLLAAGPHRYYPLGLTGSGAEQWLDATNQGAAATGVGGVNIAEVAGRNAVVFDGVDDFIQLPVFWNKDVAINSPMTIVMQVLLLSLSDAGVGVCHFFDQAPDEYKNCVYMIFDGPSKGFYSSTMQYGGWAQEGRLTTSSSPMIAGRWGLLVMQLQNSSNGGAATGVRQLWVDGVLWESRENEAPATPFFVPNNALKGKIGSALFPWSPYNVIKKLRGAVSAFAIYSRLLSQEEIIAISQAADLYRPIDMNGREAVSGNQFIERQAGGLNPSYADTVFKTPPVIMGSLGVVDLPSGIKRLAGVLTRNGVPEAIPYRVYRRSDGALIKTGVSEADGTYSVTGIPDVPCYLIALDPQDEFNAGVLDRLQPEA